MDTKPLPINKVAQSGLITIDLGNFYPKDSIQEIDISQFLFKGLVLREKEFREMVLSFNWEQYKGKTAAMHCSTDAIVPQWAFMLIAASLKDLAKEVYFGNKNSVVALKMLSTIEQEDFQKYEDEKVIIKGCGKHTIPTEIYVAVSNKLLPLVQSLMYGEACSTVPVYKRNKK